MTHSPYYLAAIAVAALGDVEIVSTRPPFITTPDYQIGGVMDGSGRHWIVKYPRHQVAGLSLEAEAGLASHLVAAVDDGRLPFDVIRPRALTTVSTGGRAMVYREPFGHTLELEDMTADSARSISRGIAALHDLSPSVFSDAGVPVYSADDLRRRLSSTLEDVAVSKKVPSALLARWDRWVEADALWDFTPTPIHGDLDEDNVLWSNHTLTAITGFGEAHVGDPAEDFVWLANSLDDELLDIVVETYGFVRDIDDDLLLERVTLHSEFALARWLLHGLRIDSEEIVSDARQMLAELEESIASDPESPMGPRWRVDPAYQGLGAPQDQ